MDEKSYSKSVINRYLDTHFFFRDPLLKKYFANNQLSKFRDRVHKKHPNESFEKMIYVIVTDSIRDIILDTIGELTVFLKNMGELIISGGEAFNMYVEYKDRIITSDIDAKFVPTIAYNKQYFGKLQAIKLILWNKLGQISKRLNIRIKNRIMSRKNKFFRFLGLGFGKKGSFVTRRYTLIKKKKGSSDNKPSVGDVFIDVELFALDLKLRYYSITNGKIENFTIGGILDIPFMRPKEFGYGVVKNVARKGVSYRNMKSGRVIFNTDVNVASKEFLVEDIYLMHKLKLRPEKKQKDQQRLMKLAKLFKVRVNTGDSIEKIFRKIRPKLVDVTKKVLKYKNPGLTRAIRIDPYKYKKYTTPPSKEKLSKQFVHGLKPTLPDIKVQGFEKSSGNQRFNVDTFTWKRNNSMEYIKNEFPLRPLKAEPLPNNLNIQETLYGFKPRRDGWVPKPLLKRAAEIPFVGLKR